MKRTISYDKFLDKVYGCFIGKAVSGNIGAPHEGVKMPMKLEFLPQMIDCDRPNDDLDLQVLWLDVVERKGENFTSYDLLESFCKNCDYSPGEYVVMRKNFARGVYPPYSGKFCNDYYTEGMGCPIRSEVWGCLAVGNMELASEFASRDGQLDHYGESIWAERFLAALECEAFFEEDVHKLIEKALTILPEESAFRELVCYVVELCEKYQNIDVVRTKFLFRYGHPDCTNMYQNMAIVIASLLLGENDIIKTSMMALNCGFDTDCTCATAGAIIGLLRGADELKGAYGINEITYVLEVRCERRSNKIFDLAEDIAKLAVQFSNTINSEVSIENAPEVKYQFEKAPDFRFEACYEDMNPSILLGGTCKVYGKFMNDTDKDVTLNCSIKPENELICDVTETIIHIPAKGQNVMPLTFTLPGNILLVHDINLIHVTAESETGEVLKAQFGICGATPWKLSGPFWRTEPIITTEKIMAHIDDAFPYKAIVVDESKHEGNLTDLKRHFHLNFEPDNDINYIDEKELFTPVTDDYAGTVYEQCMVQTPQDSFRMDDFFGFKGPCTAYLSRVIVTEEEENVFLQIGHSSPFKLYLNGELVAERGCCDNWTAENVHCNNIKLRKGENYLVLRATRVNADAKFNVTFAKGMTCATHVVGLVSKNPYLF